MVSEVTSRKTDLITLCEKHGVRSLWIFGSALRDDFAPARSDLDFLVEFQAQARGGLNDVFFCLKEDLETLFDRTIDLVELKAVTNPFFRRAVELERQLLYAA